METLILYWALTTLISVAWLLNNHLDNYDYLSLADILGYVLVSVMFAWAFFIIWVMDFVKIKIKRNEKK